MDNQDVQNSEDRATANKAKIAIIAIMLLIIAVASIAEFFS